MKRDNKKALYENIMTSVAKEVKKVLNEGEIHSPFGKPCNTVGELIAELRKYPSDYLVSSWDDNANKYNSVIVVPDDEYGKRVLIQLD